MRFLSLFSGIGGLDLGLERAGWECIGQCEIEPFAIACLEKHWPNLTRWTDVRKLQASDVVRSAGGAIDAIVGGFPCQPWSTAGKGLGADDPRHLWPEYYRLIRELRPRWIIGENVPGLLPRGADAVLSDIEAEGYTCWPIVLAASDIGATHRRQRVFFVARLNDVADADMPNDQAERIRSVGTEQGATYTSNSGSIVSDTSSLQPAGRRGAANVVGTARTDKSAEEERQRDGDTACNSGADVADRTSAGLEGTVRPFDKGHGTGSANGSADLADAGGEGLARQRNRTSGTGPQIAEYRGYSDARFPSRPDQPQFDWEEPRTVESAVGSTVDGVSRRLARWRRGALKGLGNAVVPQVAELIGRIVLQADLQSTR